MMSSIVNPIIGKCMTMCPESEIRFRIRNSMVHPLEKSTGNISKFSKNDKMVKEYIRSAAGSNHLHPDLLRPPDVLLKTIRYLLNLYRIEKDSQYNTVFSFVCDRLRAVRQDMILQHCSELDTTRILGEMIPFYFETDYVCRTTKCDIYDWKIHSTQLEECLSRWIEAIARVPRSSVDTRLICAYILYNIPNHSALLDLYNYKEFLDSGTFHVLHDIILAFRSNNYVRFFRRLYELPSDSIIVAAVQAVQILRRYFFYVITIAYKSPNNKLSITAISKWLHYDHVSDLLRCFSSVSCSDHVLVPSININDSDESSRMDLVMIADIAWIQRGVAKKNPDRIRLDNDQLKRLIEGSVPESSDVESEVDEKEVKDSQGSSNEDAVPASTERRANIRGSDSKEISDGCNDAEETADPGIDSSSGIRGIAMYSSNVDDPYVTLHVDSDEEEKEEIEIRPEDNMVALAKVEKDNYTLEVFIYNEESNDWYCHHDYLLDAPPLCLEPIQYDPGNNETGKGNLIAVGTMESVINIWDLDIMNAVVPVVNLGAKRKGRRKVRDGSEQGHTDAVISLAWNKIATHVLASGGADRQILLWDLDEAKVAQAIPERTGEVQTLSWHPAENSFILAGTLNGTVEVIDCNENTGIPSASWKFETQVEQVIWNHFNPFSAFFATDDGFLYHVDMRKPGEIIWKGHAHDGSVGGLTLSPTVRGLLVTVGHDHMLCVWKVQDDGALLKIHSERQHIGAIHAAQFNPDVATVCCIGGSATDLVRIVDVSKMDVVLRHFS